MSKNPRTPRVRQQDAARQKNKRDRDAAHAELVGAEKTKIVTYRGTREDLALMQQVGGFEERDEVITLAIRYMAGLARRDLSAFLAAMDPRNPA